MTYSLTFDAIRESRPGPKWAARWDRSWPAYEAWFIARGGDNGPDRATCEAALRHYMPELLPVHAELTALAGGSDRAARFLSTWCPPSYLGGCSLAVAVSDEDIRLVRNYDLSPDLNEGLLLHSAWCGRPVMGMVEFLWGLSDGMNAAGLSIALAYGGRQVTARGFGITTILRYVLETCDTVEETLRVLQHVPSHMPYNLVLADASGAAASVEIFAGGGAKVQPRVIATNHQNDGSTPDRAAFTRTYERAAHLDANVDLTAPSTLIDNFRAEPLKQSRYDQGFGTLFTAEYEPKRQQLTLHWENDSWTQAIDHFEEGQKVIRYGTPVDSAAPVPGGIDWAEIGREYAAGRYPDWRSFVPGWKDVA